MWHIARRTAPTQNAHMPPSNDSVLFEDALGHATGQAARLACSRMAGRALIRVSCNRPGADRRLTPRAFRHSSQLSPLTAHEYLCQCAMAAPDDKMSWVLPQRPSVGGSCSASRWSLSHFPLYQGAVIKTHRDRVGLFPGRKGAASDAVHRLGFLTHAGGEPTRPGRRLPVAFAKYSPGGRRSARLAMQGIAATDAPSRKPREAVSMSLYHCSLVSDINRTRP